jgi:hypothetical protein
MRRQDYRIVREVAEWNPQGKVGAADQSAWKDGFRNSMQRRNLKDEEYFD